MNMRILRRAGLKCLLHYYKGYKYIWVGRVFVPHPLFIFSGEVLCFEPVVTVIRFLILKLPDGGEVGNHRPGSYISKYKNIYIYMYIIYIYIYTNILFSKHVDDYVSMSSR